MKRAARIMLQTAAVALITSTPVAVAATAHAAAYPTQPITVSTPHPAPGGSIHVTASGFAPNSTVQLYIHSTPVLLATVQADANGVVNATVTVPSGFAPGSSHEIEAQGTDSSGAPVTDTLSFTLAGGGGSLPFTGIDVLAVGVAGAGFVGFGSFLVFVSRRKRAARAS